MTTSQIQTLIDQANPGDTVRVPAGQYDVDAVNAPITLKSDITLDLTGSTITAIPNAEVTYRIFKVFGCNNVTIIGGIIIGERDRHLGNSDWSVGGHGHGIEIRNGSRNVRVQGTQVQACFGDGIYIEDAYQVEISRVVSDRNRRQGLSVIQVDGLHVNACQFSRAGGTPPGCGIDLECDTESEGIRNVLIEKSVFYGNKGADIAVGSAGTYANIRITPDNDFDGTTQPIWVAGNAGSLGTPWWAMILNRTMSWSPNYRWWGYPRAWYRP